MTANEMIRREARREQGRIYPGESTIQTQEPYELDQYGEPVTEPYQLREREGRGAFVVLIVGILVVLILAVLAWRF